MALGPPPCISRIIVPRFVTSIICGDDIIPRASFDSIEHMKERSWKALEAGAGKGALGWMMNTGWMTDITSGTIIIIIIIIIITIITIIIIIKLQLKA